MIKKIITFLAGSALLLSLSGCHFSVMGTYYNWDSSPDSHKAGAVILTVLTAGIWPGVDYLVLEHDGYDYDHYSYWSDEGEASKDLEKFGALMENLELDNISNHISVEFGLSQERGKEIARLVKFYARKGSLRSLTKSESDHIVQSVLGVTTADIEKAVSSNGEVENLYEKIAVRNETTPEHIKDLVSGIYIE